MPKGQKSEIKRPAFAKPATWPAGVSRSRVRLEPNFSCFRWFPIHRFLMSGKVCSHRRRPSWRIARATYLGRGGYNVDLGARISERVGRQTRGRQREMRFPRTEQPARRGGSSAPRRHHFSDAFHGVWRFAKILAERQDIATRYLPDSLVAIELRPGYFCGFYRD